MAEEEIRALVRVYVALTLAREAAGGGAAVANPDTEAATSYQGVAIRELEGLLRKLMPGVAGAVALDFEELEFAEAVM